MLLLQGYIPARSAGAFSVPGAFESIAAYVTDAWLEGPGICSESLF